MERRYLIKLIVLVLALLLGVIAFLLHQQESRESSRAGDVGLISPAELRQECLAINTLHFDSIVLGAQESKV